jgi:hypothetical protein
MAEVTNGYARSVKDQAVKGYLISPVGNPSSYTAEVAEAMTKVKAAMKVNFWDKNNPTYDHRWIEQSDIVVVLPKNNEFEIEINTEALKRELWTAMEGNKQIFLAYRSSNGIQFYRTTKSGCYTLKGIPSTSYEYSEVIRNIYTKNLGTSEKEEKSEDSLRDMINESAAKSRKYYASLMNSKNAPDRRLLISLT